MEGIRRALEVDETMRNFKYRDPFSLFVVERKDGRSVEIDNPSSLGFSGNMWFFFSADYEIIEFPRQDIRSIHAAKQEASP